MALSLLKVIFLLFISLTLVIARPLPDKTTQVAKRCAKHNKVKNNSKVHKSSSNANTGGNQNQNQNLQFNGQATFYNVEAGQGACGGYNKNSDFIAALSSNLYQPGSNGNSWAAPHCYAKAKVEYGGKSIEVQIVDECPSCQSDSLDLSPSAFQALANPDLGVLPIKWGFISDGNPKEKAY